MNSHVEKVYNKALLMYALRRYDKAISLLKSIINIENQNSQNDIVENPLNSRDISQEEIIFLLIKCCEKSGNTYLKIKYCNMVLNDKEKYNSNFCNLIGELID